MTIQTEIGKISYTADGQTSEYAVPFTFFDKQIAVYADNTRLVYGLDYLLEGSGEQNNARVAFLIVPPENTVVTILRDVELTQLISFMEGENFPASDYEYALDKIMMALQQLRDRVEDKINKYAGSTLDTTEVESILQLIKDNIDNIRQIPEISAAVAQNQADTAQTLQGYYKKSEVDARISSIETVCYKSVLLQVSNITADESYEAYPYRGDMVIPNATANSIPFVVFDLDEAISGNFAPIAIAKQGAISVYMKEIPASDITIPCIILH